MKSHFVPLFPMHSPLSMIYSSPQATAGVRHPRKWGGGGRGNKVRARTHGSDGSRDVPSAPVMAQLAGVCQGCLRLLMYLHDVRGGKAKSKPFHRGCHL